MTRFGHVDDQKAAGFPVTAACEAAGVSMSGYYDWCERKAVAPTELQPAEAELVALIRGLFDESDGNYGVPRMYKALRKAGLVVNRKRVARLMRRDRSRSRGRAVSRERDGPSPTAERQYFPRRLNCGIAGVGPTASWRDRPSPHPSLRIPSLVDGSDEFSSLSCGKRRGE